MRGDVDAERRKREKDRIKVEDLEKKSQMSTYMRIATLSSLKHLRLKIPRIETGRERERQERRRRRRGGWKLLKWGRGRVRQRRGCLSVQRTLWKHLQIIASLI